jgi:hypothetical protein
MTNELGMVIGVLSNGKFNFGLGINLGFIFTFPPGDLESVGPDPFSGSSGSGSGSTGSLGF